MALDKKAMSELAKLLAKAVGASDADAAKALNANIPGTEPIARISWGELNNLPVYRGTFRGQVTVAVMANDTDKPFTSGVKPLYQGGARKTANAITFGGSAFAEACVAALKAAGKL